MAKSAFTGRLRKRQTRWTVRFADRAARTLITLGGLGIVIAVCFVFIFLAWVVVPLFQPGDFARAQRVERPPGDVEALVDVGVDEYQLMGWSLFRDGTLATFRLEDGKPLRSMRLVDGPAPSAITSDSRSGVVAFGYSDGSVRLGRMGFTAASLGPDAVSSEERALKAGQTMLRADGILGAVGSGQFVHQRLGVAVDDPIPGDSAAPVLHIDVSLRGDDPIFASYASDGVLRIYSVSRRTNLITGKITTSLTGGSLPIPAPPNRSQPRFLRISSTGDAVYVLWSDGRMVRVDAREIAAPKVAEVLDVTPREGVNVTAIAFMIGRTTLAIGDSSGRTTAWFRVKPPESDTPDGAVLVAGHVLDGPGAAVTALSSSARARTLAVGYGNGEVRLFHLTSGQGLAHTRIDPAEAIRALTLSPKDDGVVALDARRLWHWGMDIPHPEATVAAVFAPIWYESYLRPEHVWQSSSGTDDFEPKFGMVPLIFGTLKATVYTMLFGVPVALLAAVYTSEFLHWRLKARIKPLIEMMASLPSVVLGFLAALIIAPFVEDVVPHLLTSFFAIPLVFLLGAHLWQLLPRRAYARLAPQRLWFVLATIPFGAGLAWLLGPLVERLLFAGNLKLWLDGRIGTGTGGWVPTLLPLAAILAVMALRWGWRRVFGREPATWSSRRIALAALARFSVGVLLTLAAALALAWLFNAVGWDPRGGLYGTYVQRNALVVGFVMGFAVIPIVYTISEDALSAVPEHLRSGSLAAGATPWQTAVRIIVPTAMSGLFSATMIGFGRAIGETMVVLMAAGNTPVLEWNIFNGFRTLSANIAVELPEAVRNSTHYRMLFLAALSLFVMTFAVNTVAEIVRQRFRKRAYQL